MTKVWKCDRIQMVLSRMQNRALAAAMSAWLSIVYSVKTRRTLLQRSLAAMLTRDIRRVFDFWVAYHATARRRKRLLLKGWFYLSRRLLYKSVNSWIECVEMQKVHRNIIQKFQHYLSAKAFRGWVSYSFVKQVKPLQSRNCVSTRVARRAQSQRMQRFIACWRGTVQWLSRRKNLVARNLLKWGRKLTHVTLVSWIEYCANQQRCEQLLCKGWARISRKTLVERFAAWQEFWVDVCDKQRMEGLAILHEMEQREQITQLETAKREQQKEMKQQEKQRLERLFCRGLPRLSKLILAQRFGDWCAFWEHICEKQKAEGILILRDDVLEQKAQIDALQVQLAEQLQLNQDLVEVHKDCCGLVLPSTPTKKKKRHSELYRSPTRPLARGGEKILLDEALERIFRSLHSKAAAYEAFRQIDQNGDGSLDSQEFQEALEAMGLKLTVRQIHLVMNALDTDRDGTVNLSAFIEAVFERRMAKLRSKLQAASYTLGGQDWGRLFNYYDRDNSGHLSFEEFRRAVRKDVQITVKMMTDEELQEMFDAVDESRDGIIDVDEFVRMMTPKTETTEITASVRREFTGGSGAKTLRTDPANPQSLAMQQQLRRRSRIEELAFGGGVKTDGRFRETMLAVDSPPRASKGRAKLS